MKRRTSYAKVVWAGGARPGKPPADLRFLGKLSAPVVWSRHLEANGLAFIRSSFILTGVWDNTDAADGQIAYISSNGWGLNGCRVQPVADMSVALYVHDERITEWDGRGWARVVRPIFIVNGINAALLEEGLLYLPGER